MGLFTKKLPSHEEKLSLAYRGFKQDMVEMIFPGKKEQADCVIRSLAIITSTNLNSCDAKDYFDILSIFSGVLIRCVVTHSEDSHIVAMLQQKHGNYVKSNAVAQKVLTYCRMNMNNTSFALNSKEDLEALDVLNSLFESNENMAKGNSVAQTQNLDDPQYGLIPEKPVYAKSVAGSEQYLNKLRTEDGGRITWNRRGSTSVSGVNGMVDIYDCCDANGKMCGTIYINMYGTQNSNVAPVGFIMEGEDAKKPTPLAPVKNGYQQEAGTHDAIAKQSVEPKQAEDIHDQECEVAVTPEMARVAEVKEKYPEFDLDIEKKNQLFSLLLDCNVDMLDVYEVLHKGEVFDCIATDSSVGKVLTEQQARAILDKLAPPIKWTPRTVAEIEELAVRYGMTMACAIEWDKLDSQCAQSKIKMQQDIHSKWAQEAVAVNRAYPIFGFEDDLKDPRFKQLIAKEIPMMVAYEIVNRDKLFAPKTIEPQPAVEQKRPMFCRKCGAKLLSDSVFCMKCGTKVQVATE